MINQNELNDRIEETGLKPADIVRLSLDTVSLSQAQQWLNAARYGRNRSKAVTVLLWYMCDMVGGKDSLPTQPTEPQPTKERKEHKSPPSPTKRTYTPVLNVSPPSRAMYYKPYEGKGPTHGTFMNYNGDIYLNYKDHTYRCLGSTAVEIAFTYTDEEGKPVDLVVSGDFHKESGRFEINT